MTAPTLEYSQARRPLMTIRQWLIITYVCALLPLVVGVAATGLFLVTYIRGLEVVGLFVAVTGLLVAGLGGISWLIWVLKTRELSSRRWWLQTLGAMALLFANLPAFGACYYAAGYWRFTVVNQADTPMTVTIAATRTGQTRTVGPIQPGERKRYYWRIAPNGDFFTVTTVDADGPTRSDFFVDLSGTNVGENVNVMVQPDGTIYVK